MKYILIYSIQNAIEDCFPLNMLRATLSYSVPICKPLPTLSRTI